MQDYDCNPLKLIVTQFALDLVRDVLAIIIYLPPNRFLRHGFAQILKINFFCVSRYIPRIASEYQLIMEASQ